MKSSSHIKLCVQTLLDVAHVASSSSFPNRQVSLPIRPSEAASSTSCIELAVGAPAWQHKNYACYFAKHLLKGSK